MVIKFTIQLEDQTVKFYEDAFHSDKFAQSKQLFIRLAESTRKRKREIERAAREGVDHSLLEPISGLSDETYASPIVFSETMSFSEGLAAAEQLEQRLQRFYSEAGEKIDFIAGVSRLYKRYAQERAKALEALRSAS